MHEAGHQRRAEGANLPGSVVEREGRDVELTVDERVPLVVRLEQRGAGIDLDLKPDIRGLRLASDDLHHLVARVPLAAGELVRGLEGHLRRGGGRAERQAADDGIKNGTHVVSSVVLF
jgi:hypothetical protein